jgi:hypothetical protein
MKAQIRPGPPPALDVDQPAFNPQRGTPGVDRLAVYAGGYFARFEEALTEVYEAARHIVGAKAFAELSHVYAERYPSHDYNLSFAGRHLPEFLSTYALTAKLPFLPDLAMLEWKVCRAFHAFDQPPLDPRRAAPLTLEEWDQARLIFQPSVNLVASAWPVLDLWEARKRPRTDINVDLVNRPQRVLVFRQQMHVRCELMTESQYRLLDGLLGGETLGATCRELANELSRVQRDVSEWFAGWRRAGLITACEVAGRITPCTDGRVVTR